MNRKPTAQTTNFANSANGFPVGPGVERAGLDPWVRVHPSRPRGGSGSVVGSAGGPQNAAFLGLTPLLIDQKRDALALSVREARAEYARGDVKKGTVADWMKDLEK